MIILMVIMTCGIHIVDCGGGIIRIHDMYIVQQNQKRKIKRNKPHSSSGRCGKWQWDRNFGRGKNLYSIFECKPPAAAKAN